MEENQVIIETLDGSQFEELCDRIFTSLGYQVENIKHTGDEGRDLIINDSIGQAIVAECKHWPKGTVGRPVIQKLHSAMITWPTSKGMLLTTGKFSAQAVVYANKLDVSIDLIDFVKLKGLAAQAGIDLVSEQDNVPISGYFVSPDDHLRQLIDNKLLVPLLSFPSSACDVLIERNRDIDLLPMLLMRYSLSQDFVTAVGLIHSIDVRDEMVIIDSTMGTIVNAESTNFLRQARFGPFNQVRDHQNIRSVKPFAFTRDQMIATAVNDIADHYTTVVSYSGRNNRTYTRECVPNKRNIVFHDTRQIYVAAQSISIRGLDRTYELLLVEDGSNILWLERPNILSCMVCKKEYNHGMLCNSCGATTHKPIFFRSHGFACKQCGKTICKMCAYWKSKWRFFKTILCEPCAEDVPAPKRKLTEDSY